VLAHRLYAKFGYNFLPLISEYFGLTCSLDILFLRRDAPGQLIQSGGDIDNRIKVLLDGLRMPKSVEECKEVPKEGENPFFCLLEDDSLITKIRYYNRSASFPYGKGGTKGRCTPPHSCCYETHRRFQRWLAGLGLSLRFRRRNS
jgi:hypothetical protein